MSDRDFIFGSIVGFTQTYDSWIDFVVESKLEHKMLHRNAISIWLSVLIEFLSKSKNRKDAFANLITKYPDIIEVKDTIQLMESSSKDILSKFNIDDQILIWYIRNQCLHGHLSLYYHDKLGIQFYSSSEDKVDKLFCTRNELDKAICRANQKVLEPFKKRIQQSCGYKSLSSMYNQKLSSVAIERYHSLLFQKPISE